MPLNPAILAEGLIALGKNPPSDVNEFARQTSVVFANYAKDVFPPSLTLQSAQSVMQGAFFVLPRYEDAYGAFAVELATGMQPLFTGTPPVGLALNLTPLVASFFAGASQEQIAVQTATIIDAWMRTGSVVNNSTGVVTPWT